MYQKYLFNKKSDTIPFYLRTIRNKNVLGNEIKWYDQTKKAEHPRVLYKELKLYTDVN